MTFIKFNLTSDKTGELLALSTEDGRILFYSMEKLNISGERKEADGPAKPAQGRLVGVLGGKQAEVTGRIKDFEFIDQPGDSSGTSSQLVVTAGSDGSIRIWRITNTELETALDGKLTVANNTIPNTAKDGVSGQEKTTSDQKQLGQLLGVYETSNRITCLKAFQLSKYYNSKNPIEDKVDGKSDEFEGFD
jgi:protein MAK11